MLMEMAEVPMILVVTKTVRALRLMVDSKMVEMDLIMENMLVVTE